MPENIVFELNIRTHYTIIVYVKNEIAYDELPRLAWKVKELSHLSPWRPPIYPFKTLIPLTFFMLTIQGIAELTRSIWKFKEQKGGGK